MKKLPGKVSDKRNIFRSCIIAAVSVITLISAAIMLYERYTRRAESVLPDGTARVCFIDVGQGDCTLITACGRNILIDSGEYEEYGTVARYLSDRGIERLDSIIMTHPHTDHMGSMYRIVERFGADSFIMPDVKDLTPSFPLYVKLIEALGKRGIPVRYAVPGTKTELGENCRLEFLAPVSDYDDLNNYSVVTRFVYGGVSFLLTGDTEREAERDILESGADISADVIKVPHHGSGTSSLKIFVQAVSPTYAVFSVGESNDFGHPHSNITELYRKLGVSVYRTDMNGSVVFTTDGATIDVMTAE